jgi:hypothetical protein
LPRRFMPAPWMTRIRGIVLLLFENARARLVEGAKR